MDFLFFGVCLCHSLNNTPFSRNKTDVDELFLSRLMTGLLVFSLILVCCWLRYHRYHSVESVEAKNCKLGYMPIPGAMVAYGDEYYIHQQPPQVPFAREPPKYAEAREFEFQQQHESSRYYPPPYNFIERRTPTAPPEGP